MRAASLSLSLSLCACFGIVAPLAGCPSPGGGARAAEGEGEAAEGEGDGAGEGEGGDGDGEGEGEGDVDVDVHPGAAVFAATVAPLVRARCGSCHVGARFAFASLVDDDAKNYATFLPLISLDDPPRSRLFAKTLPADDACAIDHAGGHGLVAVDDEFYAAVDAWIDVERADRCPACGVDADRAFVGWVESDRLAWGLAGDPIRRDHGLRGRARIQLLPVDPATSQPTGPAVDFLPDSFCGTDIDGVDRCDFGHLSASHDGKQLVFECRLAAPGTTADWVNDVRWNLCIAGVDDDGHAIEPRFLLPEALRHQGDTIARSDPFGLLNEDGLPIKGVFDQHFRVRRKDDKTPVFSPDDRRVFYASKAKDPRSDDDGVVAYHGDSHRNHILSVDVVTGDRQTVYLNDGGEADFPFFLQNGNLAFHTWNLERMDRHLYTQSTPDGMMELPVLFGRSQGPNMWGQALQSVDGRIVGATGRRRSSVANYVVFVADHTLGAGADPGVVTHRILDEEVFEQVRDFPGGFCEQPPEGPSCTTSRITLDPAWAPDGRVFVAHHDAPTHVLQGEDMFLAYAGGGSFDEQMQRLREASPAALGIWLLEPSTGAVDVVKAPDDGKLLRYPVWIGARARPAVKPMVAPPTAPDSTALLHIADVPLWLGLRFVDGVDKSVHQSILDHIVAVRVLVKDPTGTACLNDARPYRFAVPAGGDDHPTAMGINNATGYARLVVDVEHGGDGQGDVPLKSDRSVRLKVPAGKLLLVQGVDENGHVVRQRERLFSLPPSSVDVDVSVKRDQHQLQCAACHGAVDGEEFVGLAALGSDAAFDFATVAKADAAVDVAGGVFADVSFKGALRPLFDQKCVSCHSGDPPAGELSLESAFSPTGNFPKGRWASGPLSSAAYRDFVPPDRRVPSYNYSMDYAWVFQQDEQPYKEAYATQMAAHAPLAELMPWDPAYTNLFANDGSRFLYLSGQLDPNFGRGDKLGGASSESFLLEVLTGRDLDPTQRYSGFDHTALLTPAELRTVMAVIDTGFAYMSRCDAAVAPSGPNAGLPWGDPVTVPRR